METQVLCRRPGGGVHAAGTRCGFNLAVISAQLKSSESQQQLELLMSSRCDAAAAESFTCSDQLYLIAKERREGKNSCENINYEKQQRGL